MANNTTFILHNLLASMDFLLLIAQPIDPASGTLRSQIRSDLLPVQATVLDKNIVGA
jgi:hypothetical protein